MSVVAILGRDAELRSVYSFLDGAGGERATLVLEGEPGIGKSTLWLAAVELERSLGGQVLSTRSVEAEVGFPYVGLGDLLEGDLENVLARLAPPRRRAIEGALLLVDAPGAVDTRALGLAVRDVLQALAEQGGLLIAVDDLQWLDTASAAALSFALRRLGDTPVKLLLARRTNATQLPVLEGAPDVALCRLSLGPLSVGALHTLLRDRVDRVFARQTLLRIHEQSGGNPFYALEIAGALGAQIDPTQPLPVPQSLAELVRERLFALPPSTREALAIAATVGTASESLLQRAGIATEALTPAVEADVIEFQRGGIRFTHPLLAAAAYDPALHGRLAEIVEDPLTRSRHLALSCNSPNSDVARSLDDAAQLAAERGAEALAAELNEHALRLTPTWDSVQRHCRALATARAHQTAGEWTRSQVIARELLVEAQPGPQRAEVLVLLADLEIDALAVPLLEEALAEAEPRSGLHLQIRLRLAHSRRFTIGWETAFADARAGIAVAEELDDDELRVQALSTAAFLGRTVLPSEALVYAVRAREVSARTGDTESLQLAAGTLGHLLLSCGDYEQAREVLQLDYEVWRERDERFAAALLWPLAWVELWTGNFGRAVQHAADSHEISIQYGVENHGDALPGAWTAAYQGRLADAQQLAEHGLALCEEQIRIAGPLFPGVLGLVAAWGGDVESGVALFAEADRLALLIDWRNPHMRPWTPDYVEALLELGRIEDARRVLDVWEVDATALAQPHVAAHVTRCRGLVAAAEGRIDDAASLLAQAIREHEQLGDPFGRGRALLVLGAVRRRQRQKAAARIALEDARSSFSSLGATTWAQRAQTELGRIGGRVRDEGLTAAEHRVAALVASGRTNREAAAALFLAERTIETHLSHVYAKLGVRSRAELAMAYRPDPEAPPEQTSVEPTIRS
jgi:DNA-binding CsgD family transcriptional regulator